MNTLQALNRDQNAIDWVTLLVDRADDELTAWAIKWLDINVGYVWPELDGDGRDALVSSGVVREVECECECDDAEHWNDNWQTEHGASWPDYTLKVTADGMAAFEVTGWHCVGVFASDWNHRDRHWGEKDDDGAYSGLPSVDDSDRTYKGGSNVDDRERAIPVWKREGEWLTIAPDDLTTAFENGANSADHGDEPTWANLDAKDIIKNDDETVYIIQDGDVTEVTIHHAGNGGEYTNDYNTHTDRSYNVKWFIEAWQNDDTGEWYETREKLVKELEESADDGQVYTESEDVSAALVERVESECGDDLPDGLTLDRTGNTLHIVSEDGTDPYEMDDDDCISVLKWGWDGLLSREGLSDATGVLVTNGSVQYATSGDVWLLINRNGITVSGLIKQNVRSENVVTMTCAVLANPEDRTASLVLADALQDAGCDEYASTIREAVAMG